MQTSAVRTRGTDYAYYIQPLVLLNVLISDVRLQKYFYINGILPVLPQTSQKRYCTKYKAQPLLTLKHQLSVVKDLDVGHPV